MRVLHIPFTYFPSASGGTEVYVRQLVRELVDHEVESIVAAPGPTNEVYEFERCRVVRFEVGDLSLESIYCGEDALLPRFEGLLNTEKPDVVHFHAFTPAVSIPLNREAGNLGCRRVFTYHTATASCCRGTLMEFGERECDGVLEERRCGSCVLHGRGVPRPISRLFLEASRFVPKVGTKIVAERLSRALRLPRLVGQRNRGFLQFVKSMDRIVALSDWTVSLLTRNGIPDDRVRLLPHSLASSPLANQDPVSPSKTDPLRLGFVGRLSRQKGLHLVTESLRLVPSARLSLHVIGIDQGEGVPRFSDPRVVWRGELNHRNLLDEMVRLDALLVPSQGPETGPLVVLEAIQLGVPVIGSDLGGIREKIQPGVNGLLLPHDGTQQWAELIERCARNPDEIRRLRRPPKKAPACETGRAMASLYRAVLA